ncbi:hypothetical protein ACIBU0_30740 [Streptomyces sp. NPDC049627]|uniref:hypothetical protein n=1 Tax=Streptomyces sp. NPDC049627 TaxID=3365595 RepID=UPI00378C59DA
MGALVWLLIPVAVGVGVGIWCVVVQRDGTPTLGRDMARHERMKEVLERNAVAESDRV